jgi:adenylate cyclase
MVAVTGISAAIGAAFSLQFYTSAAGIIAGVMLGGLNGLGIGGLEIDLNGPVAGLKRRLPLGLLLVVRTVLWSGVFFASEAIASMAMGQMSMPRPPMLVHDAGTLLFAFAVSFVINFVFTLRTMLGPSTLLALVTGRYHAPRSEDRVVLFLDVQGSTGLAERLGDRDFHRFLNRVFLDATDPVLEAHGEIYRYIGDEIIVTWPRARGAESVACLFAIDEALRVRAGDYEREFGAAPLVRGALHAGTLIVGEMGDIKREIVMLGDTMNTTARIEGACRTTGRDYIASADALRRTAPLPPGIRAESLGKLPLRGKEEEIELFALGRA